MRIILDMDCVLADFRAGASRVHGKTISQLFEDYGSWWESTEFWLPIAKEGEQFWAELGRFPWFQELITLVDNVSAGAWILASSPPHHSHLPDLDAATSSGKLKWIGKHFGSRFNRYSIGSYKHFYAQPGTVLVDDREENCDKFRDNKGMAIVFPSYGNKYQTFKDDPVSMVRDTFKQMGVL